MLDRLNWKTESNSDYKNRIKILTQIHRPKKKATTLPQELLDRHPDLTEKQIKLIKCMVLSSYARRVSAANILDITIAHLGRFHTHRNKVKKYAKKTRKMDKRRKREEKRKKEMTIEKLLF